MKSSTDSKADQTATVDRKVSRAVLITSILASGMAFIDGTALSVAMPALQADLHATGANLLWVTNGFSLPLAALLLFGGALGDAFGRKRIFLFGIVGFATASLACGCSRDISTLIAARVAQGVAGALMIPGSLAMLSSFFSPAERGKAIGAWSAFSVLATTIGPVVGGLLASAGLWRGVFFINLPLALIAVGVLLRKVPPDVRPTERVRIDGWGAFTVVVGLAALNYGLIQWSKTTFGDLSVWLPILVGITGLSSFVFIELRVRNPLLPLDVFRSRTLTGASALSFLFYMGFHGTLFFLPLNLIQVQGYAASAAGLTQVPLMVLLVLLSSWAGRLVDRRGPRLPLTVGPVIAGLGFLMLGVPGMTSGPSQFWSTFLPGLLLVGVGLGLTATPVSTTVMLSVPSDRLGLASGINSSLTRIAGVFAIAVLGPVMLAIFSHALSTRTAALELPAAALVALQDDSVKLALTRIPEGLTTSQATAVSGAIRGAFVDAFRWIVIAAAAFCWLGAAVAWRMLPVRGGATATSVPLGANNLTPTAEVKI